MNEITFYEMKLAANTAKEMENRKNLVRAGDQVIDN